MSASFDLISQNLRRAGALSIDEYLALSIEEEAARVGPYTDLSVLPGPRGFENILPETSTLHAEPPSTAPESAIDKIENHFSKHGRPMPEWFPLRSYKKKGPIKHAYALRVQLSPNCYSVYCPEATLSTSVDFELQTLCAEYAVKKGVLDFIQDTKTAVASVSRNEDLPFMTLQDYYEALPRPFPELVLDAQKTVEEINAPQLTANLLQGTDVQSDFFVIEQQHQKYGCVLRLETPKGDVKVYLVPGQFHKRTEARAAVCLLAMSEGIGPFIRAMPPNNKRKNVDEDVVLPTNKKRRTESAQHSPEANLRAANVSPKKRKKGKGKKDMTTPVTDLPLDYSGSTSSSSHFPSSLHLDSRIARPLIPYSITDTPKLMKSVRVSQFTELMNFCTEHGISKPQFHHEFVPPDQQNVGRPNKVWAIVGTERLELPCTFATVEEGQERVARQVLVRLKSKHIKTG